MSVAGRSEEVDVPICSSANTAHALTRFGRTRSRVAGRPGRDDPERMRRAAALIVVLTGLLAAAPADASRLPSAPGCPVFPRTNVWNKRVDSLPVAANSHAIVTAVGLDAYV